MTCTVARSQPLAAQIQRSAHYQNASRTTEAQLRKSLVLISALWISGPIFLVPDHITFESEGSPETAIKSIWCGRRDSNSHTFRRYHLKVVRLPIPPRPHGCGLGCPQNFGYFTQAPRLARLELGYQPAVRLESAPRAVESAPASHPAHSPACRHPGSPGRPATD